MSIRTRIAIVGVGAMGCLFAARLAPFAEVVMLGSWPEQVSTLRRDGVTLIHLTGEVTTTPVSVFTDPKDIGATEFALVLVKSYQTRRAASQISHFLPSAGVAVTLQNGLGNLEILSSTLGANRAIQGVTTQGATIESVGRVRHAGDGLTHLATMPAVEDYLISVASLFKRAGIKTDMVEDAAGLIWGKLAINAGINPLTALLRVPNGFLAENPIARDVMFLAAEEAAMVARAQGIELPFSNAAQRVLEVARVTATNRSSMLQDISRGAETEIEAICGEVVAYGQRLRVDTPVNRELLRLVESAQRGTDYPEIADGSPVASLRTLISQISREERA